MKNMLPKEYDDIVTEIAGLKYIYAFYRAPDIPNGQYKEFIARKCFIELGSEIREIEDIFSGIYADAVNRPNVAMQESLKYRADTLRNRLHLVKGSIGVLPLTETIDTSHSIVVSLEREYLNLLQRINYLKTYPELIDGSIDIDDELEIFVSKINSVVDKLNRLYRANIYTQVNL